METDVRTRVGAAVTSLVDRLSWKHWLPLAILIFTLVLLLQWLRRAWSKFVVAVPRACRWVWGLVGEDIEYAASVTAKLSIKIGLAAVAVVVLTQYANDAILASAQDIASTAMARVSDAFTGTFRTPMYSSSQPVSITTPTAPPVPPAPPPPPPTPPPPTAGDLAPPPPRIIMPSGPSGEPIPAPDERDQHGVAGWFFRVLEL